MFRQLMAWILRADLTPCVAWEEPAGCQVLARVTLEVPRMWSGRETLEQVLCAADGEFVLLKRWHGSGQMARVRFAGPLQASAMRIAEFEPGPPPVYRLQVWPVDSGSVVYHHAWRTWFGLWRNQSHTDLGAGLCFIDGANRAQLKELRSQLLGGNIPASLITEEEMWERINGMSEEDRRAAMATLAMQGLAAADRKFHEAYPDAGPVPDDLQPAFDAIQQRIAGIQQTAADRPVDPELEKLMQRFVLDATQQANKQIGSPPAGEQ